VDADDEESREKVAGFAEKLNLTHRIVIQGDQVSDLYDVQGVMPTAFWIDHRGLVVYREVGFRPEMEKGIERRINDLIQKRDRETKKGAGAP